MIYPELRAIVADIDPPELPPDPTDCIVPFQLLIGPTDEPSAEAFSFVVLTPIAIQRDNSLDALWGHGYLIVPVFAWETIVRVIAELLASCARPTWEEVLADLGKSLRWQPGYPPPDE